MCSFCRLLFFFVVCCDSCKVQTEIYRFRIEHYLFMRLMALFFPLLWANKSIQPTLTFNSTENWVLLSRTLDGTQTAPNILAWEKNAIFLDFFSMEFTVWLCQPVKIVDIYLMTCVWIGFGTTSSAIIVLTSTILCRHEFIKFAKNTMRMNVIEALLDAYNQINIFHTIDFSEFNESQNVENQSNIAIHFIPLCVCIP